MDLGLKGKNVLVTGSSRGIGFAIAETFVSEGARVIINGRTKADVEMAALRLGSCLYQIADMTLPAECARLMDYISQELGQLDVLVCNVGSGRSVPPGDESLEEWHRVLDLNFFSATNIIAAARSLIEQSRGNVICISSICGLEVLGAPLTYSAAKAALHSYVRGMARPFGEKGVRMNAVVPGNILFSGSTWEKKMASQPDAVKTMLARDVALNRLGTANEIADMVCFLASDRSSFTTGTLVVVDGGQTRS